MRSLPALALLALAAVGCADPDPAPPPADPEALRLLDAVDASAVADAFADLDADGYEADLTVTTLGAGGQPLDRETVAIAYGSNGTRVLAGTPQEDEAPRLRDPIASALSDDPPYVDPVAREAYRLAAVGDTTIGGVSFRLVEAVLTDTTAEQGVRRVWAAVTEGGRVGAIEVERRADAAIYTERSRVRVDLAPHAGGWVPRRVVTDAATDVPLSPPSRVRTEWTIRPRGASGT
ncbi:hypothetical protein [Rubrivirga marina]|uniref:Lipoprotein n=1 Tax=Rubrivirga marina TaxID=1196024 RepID=A0A271J3Y5_9BACT|nr:hypothetical protein [Rubrivirga marina]PAP78241.1 hypothetical protein BSZ37_18315 [Rubrivirga marina]